MKTTKGLLCICSLIFSLVMAIATTSVVAEELTAQMCKEKAIAASKLIEKEGEAAYSKLRDPNGEFRFGDGEGYVWVQTTDNVMLMHPIAPDLDGTDISGNRDLKGMYFCVAFCEICEENGSGWVPYTWSKVGEESESPKVSYLVRVSHGGKEYIVGSGLYDVTAEEIKAKFPNDAVYEE